MSWTVFFLGVLIGAYPFCLVALYCTLISPYKHFDTLLQDRVDNLWDYAKSLHRSDESNRRQQENLFNMIRITRKELGLDTGEPTEEGV